MSKDTTHIRVSTRTRARLLTLIASLTRQVQRHTIDMPVTGDGNNNPSARPMTDDQVIAYLLDQRDAHHVRADAARAKKKARKQGTVTPGTTGQGDEQ